MKSRITNLLLIGTILVVGGCANNLPKGKMGEYHSVTAILGVSSKVDATGMSSTEKTIKASDFQWTLSWPGGQRITSIKDFEQKLPKEPK